MEKVRMIGIFVFMILSVLSFVLLLILNNRTKSLLTTTLVFSFITFVLLFSDKTGEFGANILGNKWSAKFQRIESAQIKIVTDQERLQQAANKIIEIFDVETKRAETPLFPNDASGRIFARCNDTISEKIKELKKIVNP